MPTSCERCLTLSENIEDLRERARAQERLLEHSEKLLSVVATTPQSVPKAEVGATAEDGESAIPVDQRDGSQGPPKPGGTDQQVALAAAAAAAAGEENEELLAAAEAVWRVSEMARNVLEGELERRENALDAAAKAAKESKEELSDQVRFDGCCLIKVLLQPKQKTF